MSELEKGLWVDPQPMPPWGVAERVEGHGVREIRRMPSTGETFKWMLWSHDGHHFSASDEFVVVAEEFRVSMTSNMLQLSSEAASGMCSPDSAKALAEKYVETLAKHLVMPLTLMEESEWMLRTTPPCRPMRAISANREDLSRVRVSSAVREARTELLASADEALRRCYDLIQNAHECMNTPNDQGAYFAVYEAMEVLGEYFGNEEKAKAVLGNIFKKAKTAANAKRHHRKKGQPQPSAVVVEMATAVIRKYERYLLDRP